VAPKAEDKEKATPASVSQLDTIKIDDYELHF